MPDRVSQNLAFVAAWTIKVDGSDLAADAMNKLVSAEVETSLELPDMAVLRFHDKEAQLVDGSLLVPGSELTITVMESGSAVTPPLFKGEIVALEPHFGEDTNVTLTVRAYDKRHRMNRETKTKVFADSKDSDAIQSVVGENGLATGTIEATSQVRKSVIQQNMTDLEFVSLLARRNAMEISMEDGKLSVKKPAEGTVVDLEWGTNLLSFHPRLSLAGQVNEVVVRAWDNKAGKALVGQASNSKSAPVIGFGQWGGQAAQSKFSAAKAVEVQHVVQSQDEAKAIAQSMLDDINAEFLEADGTANGNARIRAGKTVNIRQVGTRFAGKYRISSAQHVLEDGDHKVYFQISGARPKQMSDLLASSTGQSGVAAASAPSSFPAAAIGVVTDNKDPDDLGRVRIKFPWFDETAQSWWSRVAMIGAGNDRGFFVLPEVNDEVLVVFLHGDMDTPVVVGGLYNSQAKPPLPNSKAVDSSGMVIERMFKTRAGHVIQITDKSGSEAISMNTHNSKVSTKMDAAGGKMSTEAQSDITIESKSAKITIKATGDVMIESTQNVKVKASANVNIEGTGGVTVKGSGPVTVESSAVLQLKGSMVQIN